jgi:DNA modification methylase
MIDLRYGDCLDVLKALPDNSVDAIVTDPPYGLSFMGKKWDYDVPSEDVWRECLRVLKPGGHLLAFAGTRTQHRMAVRIEDAGFEIRDMIAWLYGSGFPKSLDVSKAIDKAAGAEREVIGIREDFAARANKKRVGVSWADNSLKDGSFSNPADIGVLTAPATAAARKWQGWGTALKPAMEPITVARKPLMGTVAENVLAHGTGAINVDGCRVNSGGTHSSAKSAGLGRGHGQHKGHGRYNGVGGVVIPPHPKGRWPANVIHDGSEEPVALLGDAARFFYCAKAAKKDRGRGNNHPTVKPTDLMRYLVRLVTPPGGVVLDPFMGSGSTGKAAVLEGFGFIGIEREEQYVEIARARIEAARPVMGMLNV